MDVLLTESTSRTIFMLLRELVIPKTPPPPGLLISTSLVTLRVFIVGLVARTAAPDPVVELRFPGTYPVQFDRVPLEGVPRIGVVNVGEVVPAKEPVPDWPLSDVFTAFDVTI